jgi:NADPH2:quinone reductase
MPLAVIGETLGGPEVYRLAQHDPGPPGAGEVRLAPRAAGVSFVDVLTAAGSYQVKPPTPFIPGSEAAGVISAVGEGVANLGVGDRVQASAWGGLFAQAVNLPARVVRRIPADLTFEEASVIGVSYATAWHALVQRGRLQAGESLLVLGAGGATGYAAVQVGAHLGARVIASASSEAKRGLALAGGAAAAVDATSASWRDEVKAANGGKGVDVVFDPVGGPATDTAFRTLAWNGRHLVVGFTAGLTQLKTSLTLMKGSALIGVDIRQFGLFEPELAATNLAQVFELAAQGVLKPAIARTYPLEDFAEAMREAAAGKTAGRVVITMGEGG